jgi:hypothetical protein
LRVKMILPALLEANAPGYRPMKYALFPPLGLAGLAGYLDDGDSVELVDEHVQALSLVAKRPSRRYVSQARTLANVPPSRRDLIKARRVAAMLPLLERTLDAFGRARPPAA